MLLSILVSHWQVIGNIVMTSSNDVSYIVRTLIFYIIKTGICTIKLSINFGA